MMVMTLYDYSYITVSDVIDTISGNVDPMSPVWGL